MGRPAFWQASNKSRAHHLTGQKKRTRKNQVTPDNTHAPFLAAVMFSRTVVAAGTRTSRPSSDTHTGTRIPPIQPREKHFLNNYLQTGFQTEWRQQFEGCLDSFRGPLPQKSVMRLRTVLLSGTRASGAPQNQKKPANAGLSWAAPSHSAEN